MKIQRESENVYFMKENQRDSFLFPLEAACSTHTFLYLIKCHSAAILGAESVSVFCPEHSLVKVVSKNQGSFAFPILCGEGGRHML